MTKNPSIVRDKCGTTAGTAAHRWYKEEICGECRIADSIYSREKYLKNFERIQARDKAKRDADPEKYRARGREWIAKNPDKKREMSRTYYLKNLEKRKKAHKEWKSKNKELLVIYSHRRRAMINNALSEPYTVQQILDLYGAICYLCKEQIDLDAPRSAKFTGWELGLQLDHVIPLSKGGSDLISNVKPSHGICNSKKNARLVA